MEPLSRTAGVRFPLGEGLLFRTGLKWFKSLENVAMLIFPSLRNPLSTLSAGLLGLGLAVVAAYLLGVTVPGKRADAWAFATAAACLPDEPSTECRKSVPATVEKAETVSEGRTRHHWLTLAERGGGSYRVDMSRSSSVFGAVSPGDRVTMTSWRGKVRYVDFRNMRQDAADRPKEAYRLPLGIGLALLPLSGMLLWFAHGLFRRTSGAPAFSLWRISVAVASGICLALIAFFAPLATDTVSTALLLSAVAAFPVALGGLWLIKRQRRRPTGRRRRTGRPSPSGA
ncbi:hypothetical protein [Streptomyces blastmyceticus]|uniref:hypothetical protein n=1 Tax=Streptomyces blastmyceticus TaxID=68180 RepID=UPI0031E2FB9A